MSTYPYQARRLQLPAHSSRRRQRRESRRSPRAPDGSAEWASALWLSTYSCEGHRIPLSPAVFRCRCKSRCSRPQRRESRQSPRPRETLSESASTLSLSKYSYGDHRLPASPDPRCSYSRRRRRESRRLLRPPDCISESASTPLLSRYWFEDHRLRVSVVPRRRPRVLLLRRREHREFRRSRRRRALLSEWASKPSWSRS